MSGRSAGSGPALLYFLHEVRAPGCPVFLNGQLHDVFKPRGADMEMDYSWPATDLWLITKDRGYTFDFRKAFGGYLVSRALLDVFDDVVVDGWERAPVKVVDGSKRTVSDVEYHFLRDSRDVHVAELTDSTESPLFVVDKPSIAHAVFCAEKLADRLRERKWAGFAVRPETELGRSPRLWAQ
jgi:hypothetical protein